jgi:hypothetical protein
MHSDALLNFKGYLVFSMNRCNICVDWLWINIKWLTWPFYFEYIFDSQIWAKLEVMGASLCTHLVSNPLDKYVNVTKFELCDNMLLSDKMIG